LREGGEGPVGQWLSWPQPWVLNVGEFGKSQQAQRGKKGGLAPGGGVWMRGGDAAWAMVNGSRGGGVADILTVWRN